jgi:hypothetical protein
MVFKTNNSHCLEESSSVWHGAVIGDIRSLGLASPLKVFCDKEGRGVKKWEEKRKISRVQEK